MNGTVAILVIPLVPLETETLCDRFKPARLSR